MSYVPFSQRSSHRMPPAESFPSPGLNQALRDAEALLAHAASHGQLPPTPPTFSADIVDPLLRALQANHAGTSDTAGIASFWIAYNRLAAITRPVTAASVKACGKVSLRLDKITASLLVLAVILASIFLFMADTTKDKVSDLIDQQNQAAVDLWSNVRLLDNAAELGGEQPAMQQSLNGVADRVFTHTVEFARRNAWLLESSIRLHDWFTPFVALNRERVNFSPGNNEAPDHLLVPPDTFKPGKIRDEAVNQIRVFQLIREYALPLVEVNSIIFGGITGYLLPTVYALLGAYLYGFRLYSRLIRRQEYVDSKVHSARYFISAIAGLVVGLFGALFPKQLALSPLAIAFLVGYAVEAFMHRLDGVIVKLKGDPVQLPPRAPAPAADGGAG